MKIPTVHLNGTSAESLAEGYYRAEIAVHDAIKALEAISVHARDYYPQGPEAFPVARAEHTSRLAKLIEVRTELFEIIEGIDGQATKKG